MSYPTGQTTGGSAPYPAAAQHEGVSPQVTGVPSPQPGPVSPQITGVTDSQANGATHITASEPPRETVESMGSGIEVVPDQPPTYGGQSPAINEKSAYPGHDQPIAQPQQPYPQNPQDYPQPQNTMSQQGYPQQGYPQQETKGLPAQAPHPRNNYQIATPLPSLQQGPAPVDCPVCGVREMTRTEYVSGGTTHLSALICCCCLCLGCVPYLASWFKDCEHKCGNCGALLAVWHRSGRTEVMAHGQAQA